MKTPKVSHKPDYLFVGILSGIICLALLCSVLILLLAPGIKSPEISDLPEDLDSHIGKLVINEVLSGNSGVWLDADGQKSDYIELYNGSEKTVNLFGYGLSDRTDSIKLIFPEIQLESGQFLLVALNGSKESQPQNLYQGQVVSLSAPFKLKTAGDEEIVLTKPNGKVADAVKTVELGKNQVMCRNAQGTWICAYQATPGFENSKQGQTAYLNAIGYALEGPEASRDSALMISEVLPKNRGNFINEYGKQEGFIELYNQGNAPVNLADYFLSDTSDIPFRFRLPQITLEPGAYYVINCGNASYEATNYTGFNLSGHCGMVMLGSQTGIVQTLSYSELENGMAVAWQEDGMYLHTARVSAGFSNDAEGIRAFSEVYLKTPEGLIISEVMPNNQTLLAQNSNRYYDWVELYNNSADSIRLSEYYLSTDADNLKEFALPDVTLFPGEYYIIMCSGDERLSNQSYVHAPFKIGDAKSLYVSCEGKVTDSLFVADVPDGQSLSRNPECGYGYGKPTPGKANQAASELSIPGVVLSLPAGIYDNVKSLQVEAALPGFTDPSRAGYTMRYTLDGSDPTAGSKVLTGALSFTKTSVLKIRVFDANGLCGPLTYASYIINENHTVPVLSVTLNAADLNYIRKHPNEYVQRQSWVEFFENGQDKTGTLRENLDGFSTPCSLALFGGNTRFIAKQSFALRFDSEWGASSLRYPVFDNRDNSAYDALVLRSGSTDYAESMLRDTVGTSLVDDYTDLDVQAERVFVLYLNGQYWGVYNLREKINKRFLQDHYNVEAADLDLLRLDGEIGRGNKTRYNAIRAYARNHDLSQDRYYQEICRMVDIPNIIDYWISELYFTNNDVLNVRYFISDDIADGKLRYIFYDLDYAWYNYNMNYYVRYLTNPEGIGIHYNYENDIILNLFKNADFRAAWLERLTYHMHNTFHPDTVIDYINRMHDELAPEMSRERARWGLTVEAWEEDVEELRTYVKKRTSSLMTQTKAFFGLSNQQMKEVFGELWK